MSSLRLRRPITVGLKCVHKSDSKECEVTQIFIDAGGQAVIETIADDDGEICQDSLPVFLDRYRLKGA